MVRKVFSIVSEPLLNDLLNKIEHNSQLLNNLSDQINHMNNDDYSVWNLSINSNTSPALIDHLNKHNNFSIDNLISSHGNNITPLLLQRNENENILPNLDVFLKEDDTILFISDKNTKNKIEWIIGNYKMFYDYNININNKGV